MDTDPVGAVAATQLIDSLSARVHLGLKEGRVAPQDVVELACELLDRGHHGDAVREAVERNPAHMAVPEMTRLAQQILAETGFDPGFALAPERLTVLRHALRIAVRDLPTAGITGEPRLVLLKDSMPLSAGVELADGRLLVGDRGLQACTGDTLPAAVAAVADLIQDDLMKRTSKVWPVCSEHRLGLHAVTCEDVAVWWCAGSSGHVAARIGELVHRSSRFRN